MKNFAQKDSVKRNCKLFLNISYREQDGRQ